jgi:hypothetical protein
MIAGTRPAAPRRRPRGDCRGTPLCHFKSLWHRWLFDVVTAARSLFALPFLSYFNRDRPLSQQCHTVRSRLSRHRCSRTLSIVTALFTWTLASCPMSLHLHPQQLETAVRRQSNSHHSSMPRYWRGKPRGARPRGFSCARKLAISSMHHPSFSALVPGAWPRRIAIFPTRVLTTGPLCLYNITRL